MSASFETKIDRNGNITRTYHITVTGCYEQHKAFENRLQMLVCKFKKQIPKKKLLPFKLEGPIYNISDVNNISSYV